MYKILVLIPLIFLSFINISETDIPGTNSISSDNLMNTVKYLSSPELKGRLGGSEGYYKAAEYMKNEFISLGLTPANNGDYFQYFNVEYNEILNAEFSLIKKDKTEKYYDLGNDYVCRGFSGSGEFKGGVAFCGYGIISDTYNDFENIDVKNKAVIIFKQLPGWIEDHSLESLRKRANYAYSKGAKAILFVSRPNDKNPQKPIGSVMDGDGEQLIDLPMIHIDLNVADDLFLNSATSLKDLQTKIDNSKNPNSIMLSEDIYLNVKCNYEKNRKTMNVAAILEGTDEKLKSEFVVIGAHLDHAGSQADKIYFPGANDNASGSASLLEIARTFVKNNIKPKRSILFIFFSNEESGLHGSNYYCENPLVPLEKTAAMLNNDCVASGDSIQVGSGLSSPNLWKIARTLDGNNSKRMLERTWKTGGADAEAFFQKEIPTLYFVTYYSYAHLHLPSDKPETLNPQLFEDICRLAYMTTYTISMGEYTRETVLK